MAQMFPNDKPRPESGSDAEELLYWEFKNQLSDEFTVMHGVRWFTRDRLAYNQSRFDKDGEADFLIAHPRLGLMVLEVKGGTVAFDGKTDRWTTTTRSGRQHILHQSPFFQAMKSVYALLKKLGESPTTRRFRWHITRAVAFPDFDSAGYNFGPDAIPEIIIDVKDIVNGLQKAIIRAYGQPPTEPFRPGTEGINALVDLLAPVSAVPRFALGSAMRQDELELARLTERQFRALGMLQQLKRVRVGGCAGSGKTMLAMQKVRSLVREGFNVIYTCYNQSLAEWVHDILIKQEKLHNVTVTHFHRLCMSLCQQAGVSIADVRGLSLEQRQQYYDEILPEKLIQAIKIEPNVRVDALVVDEGQDFNELWWAALEDLLVDMNYSPFYIFYDDNQKIYQGRSQSFPANMAPILLQENCRNTRRIHQTFLPFYRGESKPICDGPEGQDVVFEKLPIELSEEQAEAEMLRRTLVDLTQRQAVLPGEIVVLTYLGKERSQYMEGLAIGTMTLTWKQVTKPNQVHIATAKSFKGLESPVIILVDVPRFATLPTEERDNLLYVALSRAKHQLIILQDRVSFLHILSQRK